jgi:uncharacterized protein YukE
MSTGYDPTDPFSDPNDPLNIYQGRLAQAAALRQQQPPGAPEVPIPSPPPLNPDEENDLMSNVLSAPLSALGWIGESLGKPARAVRGVLSGQPSALLNLIPFSDTLGLTDRGLFGNDLLANKNDVPSGREMLDKLGITDPKQPGDGFDLGDAGGIGLEAALDPLMWGLAPIGTALGRSGQLAKDVGILPKFGEGLDAVTGRLTGVGPRAAKMTTTLGEQIGGDADAMEQVLNAAKKRGWVGEDVPLPRQSFVAGQGPGATVAASSWTSTDPALQDLLGQKLGGLAGFGPPIPGASNIATLGHGPLSQAIGQGIDRTLAGIRYSRPIAAVARLFDPESGQAGEAASQQSAQAGYQGAQRGAEQATEQLAKAYQDLQAEGVPTAGKTVNPVVMGPQQLVRRGFTLAEATRGLVELAYPGSENVPLAERSPEAAISSLYPHATPDQRFALRGAYDTYRQIADKYGPEGAKIGLNTAPAEQQALYSARVGVLPTGEQAAETAPGLNTGAQGMPTASASTKNRADELTNIIGGTVGANRFVGDIATGKPLAKRLFTQPDLDALAERTGVQLSEAGTTARKLSPEELQDISAAQFPVTAEDQASYIAKTYMGADEADLDNLTKLRQKVQQGVAGLEAQAPQAKGAFTAAHVLDPAEHATMQALETIENEAKLKQQYGANLPDELATRFQFSNDAFTDLYTRMPREIHNVEYGKQIHSLFARTAGLAGEGEATVPAAKALEAANMTGPNAINHLAGELAANGKLSQETVAALRAPMPEIPEGAEGEALEAAQKAQKDWQAARDTAVKEVSNAPIPASIANSASRTMDFVGNKSPESTSYFMNALKNFTSMFKGWAIARPANKVRDGVTGLWGMAASGLHPSNWFPALRDAWNLLQGKDLDNIGEYLGKGEAAGAAEGNRLMKARILAGRTVDAPTVETAELGNGAAQPIAQLKNALVGNEPMHPLPLGLLKGHPVGDFLKGWNPLDVFHKTPQEFTENLNKNPLLQLSQESSNFAWTLPKLAIALGHMRQGMSWQEAMQTAQDVMGDFSKVTPFEKTLRRSAIPFYTWARRVLPWTIREIANNPGGITAEAVRVAGGAGHKEFTPEQLSNDISVPLSQEDAEGNKTYLESTSLPFEVLGDVFRPGRTLTSTIGGSLAEMGGMLNPLLKMPIELATNKQLNSGRDLTDLKGRLSTTAQNILGTDRGAAISPTLEEIASNMPFAPYLTMAGKLSDPRKSLLEKATNALTGFQTATVNMPQARDVAARDAAAQLLQGSPAQQHTDLYVRKQDLPLLSPDELRLYSLYRKIEQERQQRAKAEKAKQLPVGGTVAQ